MTVEQVVVDTACILVCAVAGRVLEGILDNGMCVVAVQSACPQVDFPSE